MERLGAERQGFLAAYNPDLLATYVGDEERCWFGTAPSLKVANEAYGRMTAAMWWTAQLAAVNRVSGARDKMSDEQLDFTATALARETDDLKVTECMLFMWRLRTQAYGQFYGSVNPDTVLRALRMFRQERRDVRERRYRELEAERRRREAEEAERNAVTPEEAERLLGRRLTHVRGAL